MAQLLRVVSGVDRHRSRARRRRAASRTSDLELACLTRSNLLVVGEDDTTARLITCLRPSLHVPILARRRGERLELPPTFPPVATFVVYDVDTLTSREQQALYLWMAANRRTQVVSTSSRPLHPRLQTGAFDEELYYRLNVMMLDLTSPAA